MIQCDQNALHEVVKCYWPRSVLRQQQSDGRASVTRPFAYIGVLANDSQTDSDQFLYVQVKMDVDANAHLKLLVIWNGESQFCAQFVTWLAARDRHGRVRIVTYQACPSPPMTEIIRAEAELALYVISEYGRHRSSAEAVCVVFESIEYHAHLARFARRWPMIKLAEFAYQHVSKHTGFYRRYMFRDV